MKSYKKMEISVTDQKGILCPWCPDNPPIANCQHNPFALMSTIRRQEKEMSILYRKIDSLLAGKQRYLYGRKIGSKLSEPFMCLFTMDNVGDIHTAQSLGYSFVHIRRYYKDEQPTRIKITLRSFIRAMISSYLTV